MADDKGEWYQFPEASKYIREAVDQWHPHLQRATILAVARPEANRSAGKLVWGKFKVASPMERALYGEPDLAYIMILARDIWQMLTDKGRLALVDHELSHGGGFDSDAEKWTTVAHDVEEFIAVVQRHGLWKADLASFIEGTKDAQMTIDMMIRTAPSTPLADAVEALRPQPGSGIDSVTLSAGGHGTTLHADGRTEVTRPEKT